MVNLGFTIAGPRLTRPRTVPSVVNASLEGEPPGMVNPGFAIAGPRLTGPWMARQPYSQCSRMPGRAPESGESRYTPVAPAPLAATTIPSLSPNFICRGARFATTTTSRPTSAAGS